MRDHTDTATDLLDISFHRAHDIEMVSVTDEGAHTRWPFEEGLVGNPEVPAVHGGVLSALVDLTGAAPFVGTLGRYTPTVDVRVDYLRHAGEADLHGYAEVRRFGETIGVADVAVESDDAFVAKGRGVYKLLR